MKPNRKSIREKIWGRKGLLVCCPFGGSSVFTAFDGSNRSFFKAKKKKKGFSTHTEHVFSDSLAVRLDSLRLPLKREVLISSPITATHVSFQCQCK